MYLLEYNEQGKLYKITPDPFMGLGGVYVTDLPIPLEKLISTNSVEEYTDKYNKKYYIIKEA